MTRFFVHARALNLVDAVNENRMADYGNRFVAVKPKVIAVFNVGARFGVTAAALQKCC